MDVDGWLVKQGLNNNNNNLVQYTYLVWKQTDDYIIRNIWNKQQTRLIIYHITQVFTLKQAYCFLIEMG